MLALVGYVAAVWLIGFGPVDFDFWTTIGLYFVAAALLLRD